MACRMQATAERVDAMRHRGNCAKMKLDLGHNRDPAGHFTSSTKKIIIVDTICGPFSE